MNPRRWLHEHSLKLLAIRDTPEAIAGGAAIGIFFGFTPLYGFKTLSAILFAWLTRSNILATVIAVTLHDVVFWLMPLVYWWEYALGSWILSRPHRLPHELPADWRNWATFVRIGKPMLLGSAVCGAPVAVVTFFLTRRIVIRHHLKKLAKEAESDKELSSLTP